MTKKQKYTYDELCEDFTPERALDILMNYNPHNRGQSPSSIKAYALEMCTDCWKTCVGPIVFGIDKDGKIILLDGQGRLAAVVVSGKTQRFPVIYDAPPDSQKYIDRIRLRQLYETFILFNATSLDTKLIAKTTQRCKRGTGSGPRFSQTALEVFYLQHNKAIDFAVKAFPRYKGQVKRGKYVTGPVLAAIARAWYYFDDKERLRMFASLLNCGPTNVLQIHNAAGKPHKTTTDDNPAIDLREFLTTSDYQGGECGAVRAYHATELAIFAYMHRVVDKQTLKIRRRKDPAGGTKRIGLRVDELYPLPEKDPATGISNGATTHTAEWYTTRYGQFSTSEDKIMAKINERYANYRKAISGDDFSSLLLSEEVAREPDENNILRPKK